MLKATLIKTIPGVVKQECHFGIKITKQECNELRKALGLIAVYENAAKEAYRKTYGHNPTDADWCEYKYSVYVDSACIIIRNGACG